MIRRLIKRVVITGVGTRAAGHAVDAFKRRGWLVVGADKEFHPQHVNQFYIVSRGDHPGFVDELLMLVGRERTTLLVPTRDVEWLPIARRSQDFRRLGAAVFIPEPVIVEDIVSTRQMTSLLRRAGIDVWESAVFPPPPMHGVQWFEVTVCRDGRMPYESFVCAVHELDVGDPASAPRVERRKGEPEVEELAVRTAQAFGLPGPSTVHLRRDADGRLAVARVALTPCEYAPLTDDVLDAFLALWERVQPP
ncbi:MAG: hypothetical protein AB1451_13985 [Nitrospirota bacterium]